jgi:rare lipoprotein A
MSDGRVFHAKDLTCASFRYPLGTFVEVQSIETGQMIVIEVTDRGPLGRVFGIDLSEGAYKALGLNTRAGWGWVSVREYDQTRN